MDETIILPSPNWFQTSVMAVSSDNWLIYGGPSKSLCVLEPAAQDSGGIIQRAQPYQAHVLNRAHNEKIISVDISPEWPEKRAVLTGSSDGTVKEWVVEKTEQNLKLRVSHSHDIHHHEKEEAVGVGYCDNGYAVTVGSFGHIVKWDLNSNVVKSYNQVLKSFKPTCMACSPHLNLQVAIGTKQGVVFVLDLNGAARVIYKVRGQDDEILKIGWCPQFEVIVRKCLKVSKKQTSVATERLEKIRKEPEDPDVEKELDRRVKESRNCTDVPELLEGATKNDAEKKEAPTAETKEEKTPTEVTGLKKEVVDESGIDRTLPVDSFDAEKKEAPAAEAKEEKLSTEVTGPKKEVVDESGIGRTLPVDSFDESMVQEDDMFDIYKDHEADEFGHKKYQPETVRVKVKDESVEEDYLTECLKLKEEILKKKNEAETPIEALVDALDKAHVGSSKEETASDSAESPREEKVNEPEIAASAAEDVKGANEVTSAHIHKHLLATVGKHGSIRIWSKSGKLVGSCAIASSGGQRNQRNANNWCTLLWYRPDCLLLADGKGQLLECNPFQMDCKNKLEWRVHHSLHKRGICAMTSNAPRRLASPLADEQPPDWLVWTTSQDRNLIGYSMRERKPVEVYNTCGGFLYAIESCPYDARRVAISVGDGAVRIWEADTVGPDDGRLAPGRVTQCWANVQGKVLTAAWHPTRENCLAFGTGEARIGLLDVSGKSEKPAKVLVPALSGAVYALCWGANDDLYACGAGQLVVYNTNKPDDAPLPIKVELEGGAWAVTEARWSPRALLVGSNAGAVAALHPKQYHVLAATFIFRKMIHTLAWHPQQTSAASEESPHRNLIAACSLDKLNVVEILEYKDDGVKQLSRRQTLVGHRGSVLQVAWSPHAEARLLSTSHDHTVRIWNAVEGACTAIFGGHRATTLGAAWSAFPQFGDVVMSGGGDCCLRLWDVTKHPPERYQEDKTELLAKKEKKDNKKKKEKSEKSKADDEPSPPQEDLATEDQGAKSDKATKKFLLPMMERQINNCKINGPKAMLRKYLEKSGACCEEKEKVEEYDLDFLKIFGSINDVNEVLDGEMERHEDTGADESWTTLMVYRGHIDAVIQRAAARDHLEPHLVALAPTVSLKFWKDVTQLYVSQIDRLIAKKDEKKLTLSRSYGGWVHRRAGALLALHDARGAVATLTQAGLYKEAYVLCRLRYIDSIAEETLRGWAQHCAYCGKINMAAVCYIALGDISEAAAILGKSTDEEALSLAADLAKMVGQNTFASHIEERKDKIISSKEPNVDAEEALPELPSRVDVIVKSQEIAEEREVTKTAEDVIVESQEIAQETEVAKTTEDVIDKSQENADETEVAKTTEDVIVESQEIAQETEVAKTTDDAVEGLTSKIELLMNEKGSTHKGDGDGIQNGDVQKSSENVEVTKECQTNGEEATL